MLNGAGQRGRCICWMDQVSGAGVCVEWSRSEGQVYVLDGAGSGAGVC